MKRAFLIVPAFIAAIVLNAYPQEIGVYGYQKYEPGQIVLLFGDKVNVRGTASPDGKVVAQLPIGAEVMIVEKTEELYTLNDYTEEWYKVEFKDSQGMSGKGYIWGGLISKTSYMGDILKDGVTDIILVGVTDGGQKVKVRLLQNGKMVYESPDMKGFINVFGAEGQLSYVVNIELVQGLGFTNPADAIRISFLYEACDVTSGEILLLTDGKKTYYVATLEDFGNELAYIHHEVVFPSASKKDTKLSVILNEELTDEETGKVIKKEKTEVYTWDGKSVKKTK